MGITPHALERGGGDKSEILSILDLLLGQSKEALLLPPSGSFLRERGKKPKYNLPSRKDRPSLRPFVQGRDECKSFACLQIFFRSLVRIYPPRHILGKARVKQGEGGKKIVERRYHYLPPQIFSPYPPAPRPPQTSHFGGIAHPQEISQLPPPFKIAAIAKQSAFMSQSEKHARIDYNYALHFNIMYIIHPI